MDADHLAIRAIHAGDLAAVELSHLGDAEPAFREQAHAALSVYQGEADRHVSAMGVEPDDLWTWARQHQPAALREAMTNHYVTRDPSAYAKLAEQYVRSVAPDAATIRSAGLATATTRSGEQLVSIGGFVMTAKAAARAGLL